MKDLLLAGLAAVIMATSVSAKSWRGITPLKSTRSDVERILGQPKLLANFWATYETEAEGISIRYANGLPCGRGANSEWNVPEWHVISITVSPKTIILFSSLSIDHSKYSRSSDAHHLDRFRYSDEERGEAINVSGTEVSSFLYIGDRASNHLKCSDNRLTTLASTPSAYKLDEYGDLNNQDEKSRLDNFAIALNQWQESKGYILSYSGGTVSPSMARRRAARAKGYLERVWNIKPSRLVQSYGGQRSDFAIELHVGPQGGSAPVPFAPPRGPKLP